MFELLQDSMYEFRNSNFQEERDRTKNLDSNHNQKPMRYITFPSHKNSTALYRRSSHDFWQQSLSWPCPPLGMGPFGKSLKGPMSRYKTEREKKVNNVFFSLLTHRLAQVYSAPSRESPHLAEVMVRAQVGQRGASFAVAGQVLWLGLGWEGSHLAPAPPEQGVLLRVGHPERGGTQLG